MISQNEKRNTLNLILGITGATGTCAAKLLVKQSPWRVLLVASRHGQMVYERECAPYDELKSSVDHVYDNEDLFAPPSSGSVQTAGMVVLPCTTNTLGKIATGVADTLITRAAHCHLKQKKKLILAVRETPWSAIDFDNAKRLTEAGAVVMPLSPPFYMFEGRSPQDVTMQDVLSTLVDRILTQLGCEAETTWEDLC